jgi:hypothetical protein
MKQWRIRREVIGGKEWFYPEKRAFLLGWSDFYHGLSECPIRFETHGEALGWIQKMIQRKDEPITYTYPFD